MQKAEVHYNTPSVVILDSLARQFMELKLLVEGGTPLTTYTSFDFRGNPLTVTDPRQFVLNQSRAPDDQVHNFGYLYDLSGNKLYTKSIDAGESWCLINVWATRCMAGMHVNIMRKIPMIH